LVQASGWNLRKLDLASDVDKVLGGANLEYLEPIVDCPNLVDLTLRQNGFATFEAYENPVSADAASLPFAFAKSLRSLVIRLPWSSDTKGLSPHLIRFVNCFPNLSRLVLPEDFPPRSESDRPILQLSHVRSLEIGYSGLSQGSTLLYSYLDCPELSTVTVRKLFPFRPFDSYDGETIGKVNQSLDPILPSLRKIIFPGLLLAPEYQLQLGGAHVEVECLERPEPITPADALLETLAEIDYDTDGEEWDYSSGSESGSESGWYSRSRVPRPNEGDEIALDGAEELARWSLERARELRARNDVDGAKELARSMRATGELRKWLRA
jgi:hypothetical protein